MPMKSPRLARILITVSVLGSIAVNMLAVLLPLNGISTAAVSALFQVYFVPANYVFAIWGVIYLGLLAFLVYIWRIKDKEFKIILKISEWVILGSLANAVWLFTWHYQVFYPGLLLMFILLISLIAIYVILAKAKISEKQKGAFLSLQLPFSIYLGWITVATVANVTDVLSLLKWNGFGLAPQLWAAIMILVAAVLAVLMILRHKDYAYATVIVWAITGIAQKFPAETQIVVATYLGVIAIMVIAVVSAWKDMKRKS